MSSLDLRGVGHRYPGAGDHALQDASVQVDDGQMISVVGPSGSGKSTLLRVAAGLERGSAGSTGEVRVGGRDVTGLPPERRDVTVMFQHPLLFDHLDVAGNVAFAPRLPGVGRREARRRAHDYLRLVDLEGLDRRPVASLSGGQQQRVALARALAAERGALLLDEPFSALDRALRSSMHDLLEEVRAALAPTILMITHDLDEAALAESTVVLIDGRVHQQAPMAGLYRRPASLGVARLLGGFTEVPGTVRGGIHHSRWGAVRLPSDCHAVGPAVLLLRREDLRVGTGTGGGTTTAPGTDAVVVRRRAVGTRSVVTLRDDLRREIETEVAGGDDVGAGLRLRIEVAPTARCWALDEPQTGALDVSENFSVPLPPRVSEVPAAD